MAASLFLEQVILLYRVVLAALKPLLVSHQTHPLQVEIQVGVQVRLLVGLPVGALQHQFRTPDLLHHKLLGLT